MQFILTLFTFPNHLSSVSTYSSIYVGDNCFQIFHLERFIADTVAFFYVIQSDLILQNQVHQNSSNTIFEPACDFRLCGILTSVTQTSLCNLLLSLETPNNVLSVAYHS